MLDRPPIMNEERINKVKNAVRSKLEDFDHSWNKNNREVFDEQWQNIDSHGVQETRNRMKEIINQCKLLIKPI